MRNWIQTPFQPACVLPPDAPLDEIVHHLNGNITRLQAWQSTDVSIKAHLGAGFSLPSLRATLSVEHPRNFRLRARSFVHDLVDLGSNRDRFWFWMKHNEPQHVFTCRHDAIANAQRALPIPFQPDWLIEVLGIIPIDASQTTLQSNGPESGTVNLISERISPLGQPVLKVIVVELCRGVIVEHALYDPRPEMGLIARARLSEHEADPVSGVILPRRIDLEWPQQRMRLTLRIDGPIDVNPPSFPDGLWNVPDNLGAPIVDLSQWRPPVNAAPVPR